jgi:osmotically-inducible protein OsmY
MFRFRAWDILWVLSSLLLTGCSLSAGLDLFAVQEDSTISKEGETKLAAARKGDLSGIMVSTGAGVVTLVGTVQKPEQKARAADLARQVKGVKRVKNDLEIRDTHRE